MSSSSITQLLYRSESLIGADSALQMSDILVEARPNNARSDITGILTAVGGRFVQIVEGPAEAIDDLLDRLVRDPRHRALTVLDRRTTETRQFGDWDMVSPRLAPTELALMTLLLENDKASIDDYAAVLTSAVRHQEAVLEGRRPRHGFTTITPDVRHQSSRPPKATG
ncbi:hypothetical protein MMB232_00975 [Brevundimonas subvibrioides]|uniref:BLUF domain-containing protein n=1 Tax=Brevundimonas subvibrioides TaxID=74313 RepID=UPI0032D5703A